MPDYEAPLWEQITEARRMLDTALLECKERGRRMVLAKAEYCTVKANAAFSMREEGFPVTFIQDTIKGVPEDGHDHTINSTQYGWIPYRAMIGSNTR